MTENWSHMKTILILTFIFLPPNINKSFNVLLKIFQNFPLTFSQLVFTTTYLLQECLSTRIFTFRMRSFSRLVPWTFYEVCSTLWTIKQRLSKEKTGQPSFTAFVVVPFTFTDVHLTVTLIFYWVMY